MPNLIGPVKEEAAVPWTNTSLRLRSSFPLFDFSVRFQLSEVVNGLRPFAVLLMVISFGSFA